MSYIKHIRTTALAVAITTLSACGGGGGGSTGTDNGGTNNGGGSGGGSQTQNQAPTAAAGSDISVNEQTAVTLTGSGTDPDGSIDSYLWKQTAGIQVELSDTSSATTEFTTPTLTDSSVLTFELRVTDNQGLAAVDEISVSVNPVNQLPVALAGDDISLNEQIGVTFNGKGTDSDGSVVSQSWSQIAGTSVTLSNANTANFSFITPVTTIVQQLIFELTVTDNEGASASDNVAVTINPVNIRPQVSAGNDMSVNEQTSVSLAGVGSDADGTIAAYSWAQSSGSTVTLSDSSSATPNFTSPILTASEQLHFALTVTDNEGLAATDSVVVTVNPVNAAPELSAGDDQVTQSNSTVTLAGSASDTDGTITATSWIQTQGITVALADSNAISTTFTAPEVSESETLSFTLTATDNEGSSSTDSVTITVNRANTAPTAEAGNEQIVTAQSNVTLSGSGTDSDGEIVQYQWTQTAGANVTIINSDNATASFTAPNEASQLTFELQVTDNQGATASDTVNIQVSDPHTFALIDSQQQANEYGPATELTWSVENYDDDNHTLTWKVTTDAHIEYDTQGSSFDNPTTIEFTTPLVHKDTNVTIEVTLNDGTHDYMMGKTITMLAQGSVTFDTYQQNGAQLVSSDRPTSDELSAQDNSSALSTNKPTITDSTYLAQTNDNDNDANFSQFKSYDRPANASYVMSESGDFDGDSDIDVAIVYEIGSENVPKLAWYENEGGVLKDMVVIDSEINTYDDRAGVPMIIVGNFADNGKTDIIVATSSTNDSRPNILYAHTDSGFDKSTAYYLSGSNSFASYSTRGVQTIDINQDGFDDILTWQSGYFFNNRDATTYYLINDQDGSFTTDILHFSYGTNFKMAITDVDGDGDSDVIHGNGRGVFSCDIGCVNVRSFAGKLIWYENIGDSFSKEKKLILNSDNAYLFNAGDFDSDGDIDIITPSSSDDITWFSENKLK